MTGLDIQQAAPTSIASKAPVGSSTTPITKEIDLDKVEQATTGAQRRAAQTYTTHGGVVLKYEKVNSQLLFKAWSALDPPAIPEVWIENRGRYEPNPMDPTYRAAMAQYNRNYALLSSQVYFMRGLVVVTIPDSVIGPASDEWFEGLEDVIKVPTGKLARQTAWLMFSGVLTDAEQELLLNDLAIFSGMLAEEDIEEAQNSFPSGEGQQTDT